MATYREILEQDRIRIEQLIKCKTKMVINSGFLSQWDIDQRLNHHGHLLNSCSSAVLPQLLFKVENKYYINTSGSHNYDQVFMDIDPILAEQSKDVEYHWQRYFKFMELLKAAGRTVKTWVNPWQELTTNQLLEIINHNYDTVKTVEHYIQLIPRVSTELIHSRPIDWIVGDL